MPVTRDSYPLRRLALTLLGVGLIASGSSCGSSSATGDGLAGQWYHASLANDVGDTIPFFLRVPEDCETETAVVVNGDERIRTACRRSPVGFVVEFPVYGTLLEAWFKPDGSLVGHWCREFPTGREPILALRAAPVSQADPATRFTDAPGEAKPVDLDLSGVWRVEFEEHGRAKGVFRQEPSGVVTGTIEAPFIYGDMRFLAGNVVGRNLHLSTFDGQRALVFAGEVGAEGAIVGTWVRENSRERFFAEREDEDDLEMPDPLTRVAFAPDVRPFELDALEDPRFDGKAVIVQVFGTWCPNCNDHAPLLAELYRSYRADGLEILGLAYELVSDPDEKERRVQAFRKKHAVEWKIAIAEAPIERLAVEGVAGFAPMEGVPVTLFLNRDHTVHAIYSGFSGPATGEAHRQAIARFEALTAEILAEP